MPSKSKKSARSSPSPLSKAPSTPSSTSSCQQKFNPDFHGNEVHFQNIVSEASKKFPKFINENAFIGRICDQDKDFSKGNQARVWMSESALVSACISPGSLVSVSLPSPGKESLSTFPLECISEEYAKHFNVDIGDSKSREAGSYFAIATVFPSSKILKDGVKLSWGLTSTMGFPTLGRPIFVFPIKISDHLTKKNYVSHAHVHECTDLHLHLIPTKPIPVTSDKLPSGNGPASPKTPSSHSRFSSPTPRKSHDSISCIDFSSICSDVTSVKLALEDEKAIELLQACASRWLHGRYLLNENIVTVPLIFGKICTFIVEGAERHDDTVLVASKTKVHFSDPYSSPAVNSSNSDSLEDTRDTEACNKPRLGGLSKEIAALKEIIMFSLANKDKNLPRYKGVLLHGPPGTGKTSLASYCAREANASLFTINGPEIISQYFGESEQALHQVFDSARLAAPSVIFIDELDAIAPTRKDGSEDLSLRMVATLLKLMDEIKRDDNILLIAATNRPDSIDPAMRRPGRLDREIEIGVPSPDQRLDILHTLLCKMNHSLGNTDIQNLASLTHGFVGADLAALCNEAAMISLRRYIKSRNSVKTCINFNGFSSDTQPSELHRNVGGFCVDSVDSLSCSLSELTVSPVLPNSSQKVQVNGNELIGKARVESALLKMTSEDFEKAKMKVRPSAMREVMLELPKIRWEDVGGQENAKQQLIEAVQWPQICPDAFNRIGIRPPRGLLMIGPPGCSKTLMARAVASEAKLNFLAVKGPELFSKWVGESEKAVRSLFAKARANSPAIIFFDEIDGLAVSRGQGDDGTSVADRVLSQLLVEMDGLGQRVGVTVIAATNRPDKIDPALLRPGRFDRLLDVQPPDETDREDIFRIHTRNIPCHTDVSMKELAQLTEGYTGADIKLICREAALAALEESLNISEVSMDHFKIGIGRVQPSDVQFYRELASQFRRIVDR